MSSVWISRRGAGGSLSGAWAVICVACPAGSRCTVRRDGIVLRGLSRDGIVFFAVPSAGEWLVSVTDGEREKSKTVTVAERGEMVRVLLRCSGESLFEPGSGTENLWRTIGGASVDSALRLTNNLFNGVRDIRVLLLGHLCAADSGGDNQFLHDMSVLYYYK